MRRAGRRRDRWLNLATDHAYVFNIQHPSLSFLASDGQTRPHSATIVIAKKDGSVIGT
jgi:hypothetical protein